MTNAADVDAGVGSLAAITTTGAIVVDARLQGLKNQAVASTLGLAGGQYVAVSVTLSEANVGGGVSAGMDGDILGASTVTVEANGGNRAEAHTISVAIGVSAARARVRLRKSPPTRMSLPRSVRPPVLPRSARSSSKPRATTTPSRNPTSAPAALSGLGLRRCQRKSVAA